MKKLIILGAAFVALHASLDAQSLNVTAPGYTGTKLFDSTAGFTITGLAADTNGDIYYLESDSTNYTADTLLYKRTAASGYATPAAPLFNLGSGVFGSFVTLGSGKVFFGENSTNKVYAINPDGSGGNLLGTVTNNYDAVFANNSLFISHNPDTTFLNPQNRVSKFDLIPNGGGLSLGTADQIIETGGDYSGPVARDANGSLFYGATGFLSVKDLYRFNALEVAGAFGPTTLTLDAAHRVIANGSNAYLAEDAINGLWQDSFTALNLIDVDAATSTPIATTTDSLGQLEAVNGEVYANVTNFTTARSSVYAVVPEPGSAALLAIALGMMSLRRRLTSGRLCA
jgi:hypothetical protein